MSTPRDQLRVTLQNDDDDFVPDYLMNSPFIPPRESSDRFFTDRIEEEPVTYWRTLSRWRWRKRLLPLLFVIIFGYLVVKAVRHEINQRWYSGPVCLQQEAVVPPNVNHLPEEQADHDWKRLAYVLYATNTDYLCNALMAFDSLHGLESKASRVLMYPSYMSPLTPSVESTLLQLAKNKYKVELVPVTIQKRNKIYSSDVWFDSYTKLLAFNQTKYDRVIMLDTDATILQSMDELFFLPLATVTAPRAYWLPKPMLSSHIMALTPSVNTTLTILSAIKKATDFVYDMEIINSVFGSSCSVLPHRKYAALTGEFRASSHQAYLSTYQSTNRSDSEAKWKSFGKSKGEFLEGAESWNPAIMFREAKFVHFSDDPLPKPWILPSQKMWDEMLPGCTVFANGDEDCRARDIWEWFYLDFQERRMRVCGLRMHE